MIKCDNKKFHLSADYRKIFELNPAIMLLVETGTGLILDANDAAVKFYGHPKSSLISMSLDDIKTLTAKVSHIKQRNILKDKNFYYAEHKLENGIKNYVEIFSPSIEMGGRNVNLLIIHKIDELKHVEITLRKNKQKINQVIKELEGMYSLNLLVEEKNNIESIYSDTVNDIISGSMQFPDKIYVALEINGRKYENDKNFIKPRNRKFITYPITIFGKKEGRIMVMYTEDSISIGFSEKRFLNTYAKRLSKITERILATEKLQLSEAKYRNLYTSATLGIFHSNFNDRLIDMNPAFAKMMGYNSPEELLRQITSISRQIHVGHIKQEQFMGETLKNGGTITVENPFRRKDGTYGYGILHLRIVFDQNNKPSYYEGIVEDITNRRQIEKELSESEIKFRSLFNMSPDPILIIEQKTGKIADMNDQVENVYGYSKEELLGKPNTFLFYKKEKTQKKAAFPETFIPISYHRKKNGEIFPVSIRISEIMLQNRKFVITAIHDLTIHMLVEQKNQKRNEELHLQEIKRLEQLLEEKKYQSMDQTLNYVQQSNNVDRIVEELKQLSKLRQIEPAVLEKLDSVRSQIIQNKKIFNWENFKHHLGAIDKNFFINLSKQNKNLSTNEIKLCSFLRINLSSKDISQITNKSARSIEVARYRLRKKLGLGKNDSLNLYFAKL